MNVSIDTNLPELEALWARAPGICVTEFTVAMEEALAFLGREVLARTPSGATDVLRNKVTTVLTTPVSAFDGDVVGLVTNAAPHTVPVETGSRPHYVPIAPLLDWVKAKFDKSGAEGRSIAYAIRHKIAKHGTRGSAMFRRALQDNERRVEEILHRAVPRIVEQMLGAGL